MCSLRLTPQSPREQEIWTTLILTQRDSLVLFANKTFRKSHNLQAYLSGPTSPLSVYSYPHYRLHYSFTYTKGATSLHKNELRPADAWEEQSPTRGPVREMTTALHFSDQAVAKLLLLLLLLLRDARCHCYLEE